MELSKPKGLRGSWLATLGGQKLPCVHSYWKKGSFYIDPGLYVGRAQDDNFVSALKSQRKAILTDDELLETLPRGARFKRKAYLSLWAIEYIEFDDDGLRFLFRDQIATFSP